MKFIQFTYKDRPDEIRVGYLEGDCVMDINARDTCIPKTMAGFLSNDFYFRRIKEFKKERPCCVTGLNHVNLKAPIHGMDKVLCAGFNYRDYCANRKVELPSNPMFFSKFSSTVIGPCDPLLIRTDVAETVDWEVELCVVMGKKASCVAAESAFDYVFGYTIAQDISARDWQRPEINGGQLLLAKSMDTFCPLGPWIVTVDEISDPSNLAISTKLNGVYKQRSNTNQMIFSIPQLIERLSSVITLLPGDIILTGTTAGIGMFAKPPEFLKPGDVLISEIEKIGVMETKIQKYINPKDVL